MTAAEMEHELRARLGQKVRLTIGTHTDTVLVLSVDRDGFICQPTTADPREPLPEFWVAYEEVAAIAPQD